MSMQRFTKIKHDGQSVTISLIETKGKTEETRTIVSREAPHPDFVEALGACLQPAVDICELPLSYKQGLRVQSVSLSEDDDGNRGAVVTMLKALNGLPAPLVLNTPHVSMRENADGGCTMPGALSGALDELEAEARAFLTGRRGADDLFGDPASKHDDTKVTITAQGRTVETTSAGLSRAARAMQHA
jgi:hypothetical protein